MKPVTIEDALGKRPFQSFLIEYDGKPVRVDHPEQAIFNPNRTVLVVFSPDEHIHLLDVSHVKAITLLPKQRKVA